MESFRIAGNEDFIEIILKKVTASNNDNGYWGGYDLVASITIESDDFKVNSKFYTTTDEISNLYHNLFKCNELLKGEVSFVNYEYNLDLKIRYDVNGHVKVSGYFRSQQMWTDNKLIFDFPTDQSYIQTTLKELKIIVDKYGENKGLLNSK